MTWARTPELCVAWKCDTWASLPFSWWLHRPGEPQCKQEAAPCGPGQATQTLVLCVRAGGFQWVWASLFLMPCWSHSMFLPCSRPRRESPPAMRVPVLFQTGTCPYVTSARALLTFTCKIANVTHPFLCAHLNKSQYSQL